MSEEEIESVLQQEPTQEERVEEESLDVDDPNTSENQEKKTNQKKKKKKSVGFAEAPVEDLREHHQNLKKIHDEKAKNNPFHKIPPELAYLDKTKKDGPKPLRTFAEIKRLQKERQKNNVIAAVDTGEKKIENFRYVPVKELSTQNSKTAINFHYSEFKLPVPAGRLVVNIKYANLNSYDLAKINKFGLNVSEEKIGLGFEFAGEITNVGSSLTKRYNKGDKVMGILNASTRRGALASSQIIDPNSDVVVVLDDETLQKLEEVDIELKRKREDFVIGEEEEEEEEDDEDDDNEEQVGEDFDAEADLTDITEQSEPKPRKKSSETKQTYVFPVEEKLPVLAKASSIPLYYCRAKQMLDHLDKRAKQIKVLINGADTMTGMTLIQLLNSSVFEEVEEVDIIGVIRESSTSYMEPFCRKFDNVSRKIHLVAYDSVNEDIVLPGESVPINYKKPELFALQILEKMFFYEEHVDPKNVNSFKMDCIVDLIGSKKYFQRLIKYKMLDGIFCEWRQQKLLAPFSKLFNGSEIFLLNVLKPKTMGSSFVLGCRFDVGEPSYQVDRLLNYTWGTSIWGTMPSFANGFSKYNYYEEMEIRIKAAWVVEALRLVSNGEIKYEIAGYTDWRNKYMPMISRLRQDSGKYVLKIEDF